MADRKISALTALTSPATGDLLPIVDVSEAADASKNKSITFGTFLRALPPGTEAAPAVAFLDDAGETGIYRSDANELAFVNDQTETGKFTTTGFQLGSGTAAAQLHLFSTDTTDQVIIENTDAGADTAPDLVLFRNSASPAASDNLGNLEFRGENDAGGTHAYAQISAQIVDPADGSEDGILDLMTADAGTTASRIRIQSSNVGIGESAPAFPLHVTNVITGTHIQTECTADDPASGGDITLYHHRADAAGQDDDVLSSIFFRGNNDNATPGAIDYASIEGSIIDATDTEEDGQLSLSVVTAGSITPQLVVKPAEIIIGQGVATDAATIATVNFRGANDVIGAPEDINYSALVATVVDNADGAEDGRIQVQTMSGGTLATRLDIDENKIGFFGETAAAQVAHVADINTTATSGALPAANDTNTIADAAAPTNAELLQYCVTLEAKVEALLAFASAHGLMASS